MTRSTLVMTAQQMHAADLFASVHLELPPSLLMQRAGQGIADAICVCLQQQKGAGEPVLILAGTGNNGGDGFAAARLLHEQNIYVSLLLMGHLEKLHGDAAVFAQQAKEANVSISESELEASPSLLKQLNHSCLIVDALFGTGLNREMDGTLSDIIVAINRAQAPKLAIDIASGIHSDTGRVLGAAVKADFTVPIAAHKWGHWLADGPDYAGTILPTVDIGITEDVLRQVQHGCQAKILSQDDIKKAILPRHRQAYKQNFGHLWVFGGSTGYTGAPQLVGLGAMAMEVGLVSIACPQDVYPMIASSALETMVHPQESAPWQHADALVAGPGWGKNQEQILLELLMADKPLLLDADALNMLSNSDQLADALRKRKHITILTPHPGEAAHLLKTSSKIVQEDRLHAVLTLVEKYQCWIILKGAGTLIASPEKAISLCPYGSVNLARAGTGDVLAGMVGAMIARQAPYQAAIPAAVALHALAGECDDWYRAGQLPDRVAMRRQEMIKMKQVKVK
ncbi:MAG: NAD(P)H-hydrate dehydratase [Mariprofundaceae bacterium]